MVRMAFGDDIWSGSVAFGWSVVWPWGLGHFPLRGLNCFVFVCLAGLRIQFGISLGGGRGGQALLAVLVSWGCLKTKTFDKTQNFHHFSLLLRLA